MEPKCLHTGFRKKKKKKVFLQILEKDWIKNMYENLQEQKWTEDFAR